MWFLLVIWAVCVGTLLLAGCAGVQPEKRIQWVGTSRANEMVYSYGRFSGSEEGRVRLEAGQTVVLAYAAEVDAGTLALRVQSPSGAVLWEVTLQESVDEQQVELTAAEDGAHKILVVGDEAKGQFALSWSVR